MKNENDPSDKRNVVQDSLEDEDDDKESKHLYVVKIWVELYICCKKWRKVESHRYDWTIVWLGSKQTLVWFRGYFSSSSSFSPLHLLHLLHPLLVLWVPGMEDPSLLSIKDVSMEHLVRYIDETSTCEETKSFTKRKLWCELGSDILHSSVIAWLIHILVVIWIRGASVNRNGGWSWYVR